jgi:hypothetical protein
LTRTRLLALVSVLSCAFTAHAATPQQVAFIGGSVTYQWQQSPQFQSNPGWQGYGFVVSPIEGACHETSQALTVLQNIIASGSKPIIHLMVGTDESDGVTDSSPGAFILQSFQTCFDQIITTAQNAKLTIVVGTNPYSVINDITPFNEWIVYYCGLKGIPVIDYYTALKRENQNLLGDVFLSNPSETGTDIFPQVTTKGYVIMDALAATVIGQTTRTLTLNAGYLGNDALQEEELARPQSGVNNVAPGTKLHWYAYGEYSDGVTREINNANAQGLYGTWRSSNPGVVDIDPYGNAWTLAPGTANITFTTLSGVEINEWIMTVTPVSAPTF